MATPEHLVVNHVAVCIPELDPVAMDLFMQELGLRQYDITPENTPQYCYEFRNFQRWYTANDGSADIHIVERPGADLVPETIRRAETVTHWGWGHICIICKTEEQYDTLVHTDWCTRNAGLGRAWLVGPGGVRVELRHPHAENDPEEVRELQEREGLAPAGDAARHRAVLEECLAIVEERDATYGNHWSKYGSKGCTYNARRKVERGWEHLWKSGDEPMDVDDLLDAINYLTRAVIEERDGNRNGKGTWW